MVLCLRSRPPSLPMQDDPDLRISILFCCFLLQIQCDLCADVYFLGFPSFRGPHPSNRGPLHPAQKRRLALSPTFPVSITSIPIARAIASAAIPVSPAMAACSATTPAVTAAMAILASIGAPVVAVSVAAIPSGAAIAALIPTGTAGRAAIVISGPA